MCKNLVNEFIRSVLCIDDEAYSENGNLNSKQIVDSFASEDILCTLYSPSSSADDLIKCINLAKKADVLILDWRMFDVRPDKLDSEDISPDCRGQFAKEIIQRLVRECQFQAKLIIVYTAETRVDIVAQTKETLQKATKQEVICFEDKNVLSFGAFRIVFVRKGEKPTTNDHKLYFDESHLPAFVLREYADMTSGLLQQFGIFALNLIRNNTNEILAVLSSDSDYAYLVHKATQVHKNDSINLIELIFVDLIRNLISSNINEFENIEKKWLANVLDDSNKESIFIDNDYKYPDNVTRKERIRFIKNIFGKFDSIKTSDDGFFKFASLSQLRIPLPHNQNTIPSLSLGTILECVESSTEIEDSRYYLCIQPMCDSVRLTEPRSFLFLPLVKLQPIDIYKIEKSDVEIIVNKDLYFRVDIQAYNITKIKFAPSNSSDRAQAKFEDCRYVFSDVDDNKYLYLGELSETYAWRVVSRFAAQLGRIGIDEFEWLRLLKNK